VGAVRFVDLCAKPPKQKKKTNDTQLKQPKVTCPGRGRWKWLWLWLWRHACQQTEKMGGMGRGNAILGCQALAEKLASTTQILNRFLGMKRNIFFIQKA